MWALLRVFDPLPTVRQINATLTLIPFAGGIYIGVAFVWLIPDRRVAKVLDSLCVVKLLLVHQNDWYAR